MKTLKQFLYEKVISAALILTDGNNILVGRITNHNKWDLPKGHVDPNETGLQAVIREVSEETGLKINKKDLIDMGVFSYNHHKNLHFFILHTNNLPDVTKMKCTSTFINNQGKEQLEIDKHQYIKIEDVNKYMYPNMAKSINTVLTKFKEI